MAKALNELIDEVSAEYDADILAYFGDINRPYDDELIANCRSRQASKKTNVILFLVTRGGDPSAGYRISRCLQDVYCPKEGNDRHPTLKSVNNKNCGKFTVFINSTCKSAGTIIALGADEILMTENAELGPIDVQLRKPDEVGERTSGLTPIQALQFLEDQSLSLFKRHFTRLRFDDELVFSTKMAAELATNITIGLLSPIYEQIDPIRLAEVNRSLKISTEYGERLKRDNLKSETLDSLIAGYPSHGFVIDLKEAKKLFTNVNKPSEKLFELGERFRTLADMFLDGDTSFMVFVNDRTRGAGGPSDTKVDNESAVSGDGEKREETEQTPGSQPETANGQQPGAAESGGSTPRKRATSKRSA